MDIPDTTSPNVCFCTTWGKPGAYPGFQVRGHEVKVVWGTEVPQLVPGVGSLGDEVPQKLKLFLYRSMDFFCTGCKLEIFSGVANPESLQ